MEAEEINRKMLRKLKHFCSGCAHEATDGKKGLNKPSGERPCVICVRNPKREANFIVANNDVQIQGPKDMYVALDRLTLELQGLHTQHPWI